MKYLKLVLRFWDLELFWLYSLVLTVISCNMKSPLVSNHEKLWLILIVAAIGGVLGTLIAQWKPLKIHLRKGQAKIQSTQSSKFVDKFGTGLSWITTATFGALLISWAYAFQKYGRILTISFSIGMRAITTSLHPLVPLESRLFGTVIPFLILLPALKASSFSRFKRWFWLALFILAFGMQTKLAFLYLPPFAFLFIWAKDGLKSLLKVSTYGILVAVSIFSMANLWLIFKSGNPTDEMLKIENFPKLSASQFAGIPTVPHKPHHTRCEFDGSYWISAFGSTLGLVEYRAFGLSAAVMRLFICLRESGWHGDYRGHQLARLFGVYIPYYRLAYGQFRPGLTSVLGSAVSHVISDSYFNIGLPGVFLSGFLICAIVIAIDLLTVGTNLYPVTILSRFNALLVFSSGSLPSGLISLAPLILLLLVLLYRKNSNSGLITAN